MKDRGAGGKGFTLLELLIVIALMALITVVAAPNFGSTLRTLQTRSAVKKVSAVLRYARNQAVSTQESRQVIFNFADRRVTVQPEISPAPAKRVYQLPEKIKFYQARNELGKIYTDEFIFVFYPAGNSSGGEITISGKHLYTIMVDFITGIAEVKGEEPG